MNIIDICSLSTSHEKLYTVLYQLANTNEIRPARAVVSIYYYFFLAGRQGGGQC